MGEQFTLINELHNLILQLDQVTCDAQAKGDKLDVSAQKGFMYGVMFQSEQIKDQITTILVNAMRNADLSND